MTPRQPADLFREARDIPARNAAYRYAAAYDRFAEEEQMHRLLGNWAEAERAHRYALICLRAWDAEVRRG